MKKHSSSIAAPISSLGHIDAPPGRTIYPDVHVVQPEARPAATCQRRSEFRSNWPISRSCSEGSEGEDAGDDSHESDERCGYGEPMGAACG